MIESIGFANFKALRNATLPLAPFTLLLGPNGSGKTSMLQGLQAIATFAAQRAGINRHSTAQLAMRWETLHSITADDPNAAVEITVRLRLKQQLVVSTFRWQANTGQMLSKIKDENGAPLSQEQESLAQDWLGRMQTYALNPAVISHAIPVTSEPLQPNGMGLAAVLDDLKDNHPDRWESLLTEMRRWLPEYDYILFDKPQSGQKGIVVRTKKGGHRIPAAELSQGTLVALALLTLAYLPSPPSLIGLEEIDRGLHPRLLRHLQNALYRLSYPESCGETRPAIQVIATTHSPYLLDLYRDHPEEVVLADKQGLEVQLRRLTDVANYQEIIGESPLSEVWYSGVLGAVSVKP